MDQINALYHFGKCQYSLGDYATAANFLYHFLIFSSSFELNLSAHWGKLASNILSGEWESAASEVKELRDIIDNPHGTSLDKPVAQLQARTWLLHWSLFVFWNLEDGQGGLLEMFLSPPYLNTIQTSCPHLLRYLVAAAVISRRAPKVAGTRGNRDHVKELVKIVRMEEYQYSDPVTSFLKDLFVDFDLDQAQKKLSVAENVVRNDFFLSGFADDFVDNARYLITEVYCRIHQRIDISYVRFMIALEPLLISSELSRTLNMSNEDGEKWIVNLIRDSRMGVDAKIDLASVRVQSSQAVMGKELMSEHATHLETTPNPNSDPDRDNARSCIPITSHQLRYAKCWRRASRTRRTRRAWGTRRTWGTRQGWWRRRWSRTRATQWRCSGVDSTSVLSRLEHVLHI